MQFFVLFLVLCLAVAVGVIAVVAVGMRGMYYERNPHLAKVLAEAAQAFNGDARPPAVVQQVAAILDRRDSNPPAAQSSMNAPAAPSSPRQSTNVPTPANVQTPTSDPMPAGAAGGCREEPVAA